VVAPLAAAGCSASAAPPPAPLINVVATNYPLAQLVTQLGGNRVRVTDLAAGAPDDRTVAPTPAQVAQLQKAALVVEIGGGYQPAVEKAAGAGPRVVPLRSPAGGDPQFWLDPALMARAVAPVERALTRLDPAGRRVYANGAQAFRALLSTLSIDYQETLSDCQARVFVAPDRAFAPVMTAAAIGLLVLRPGASPAALATATATVRNDALPTIFSEPPLNDPAIAAVARRAPARVRPLDTMDGPLLPRQPGQDTYYSRMGTDLGWLASGLQCSAAQPSGP
jgi:zinc transport system substrate-binding protein